MGILYLVSEIIFGHSAIAQKLLMCPKILGNEASETPPPPFNSKYLSMPMKTGVILFRIFQSASGLREGGGRH